MNLSIDTQIKFFLMFISLLRCLILFRFKNNQLRNEILYLMKYWFPLDVHPLLSELRHPHPSPRRFPAKFNPIPLWASYRTLPPITVFKSTANIAFRNNICCQCSLQMHATQFQRVMMVFTPIQSKLQ